MYDELVKIRAVAYVKIVDESDPTMRDILTGIRGLHHVIIAKQSKKLKVAPDGRRRAEFDISFDDNHDYTFKDLEKEAMKIPGVSLFKVIDDKSSAKPYTEKRVTETTRLRVFKPHVNEGELVWHRDAEARKITVLQGGGWQFQSDNTLPIEMKDHAVFEVNAGEWHRVISGSGTLRVLIEEITSQTQGVLSEAVNANVQGTQLTGQLLLPKHFIGGGSGNPIVQRAIERADELKPGESFFFLYKTTSAIDEWTGELVQLNPQWVTLPEPDYSSLLDAKSSPEYSALSRASSPNLVLIQPAKSQAKSATDHWFVVKVSDIAHRLGGAQKSTKKPVSDKILGYICEHALALGSVSRVITREKIEQELRSDSRLPAAFDALNPVDMESVLDFAVRAIDAVKSTGFQLADAWVDGGQTAKYDVRGSTTPGRDDFNCHVKFNQGMGGSRFIGLQTGPGGENSSTDEYRTIHKQLRDEWEMKALDPLPRSATRREAGTPDAAPTELQFPGFFNELLKRLEYANWPESVANDIHDALSPVEGVMSFAYFQQTGTSIDSQIDVKIIEFGDVQSDVSVVQAASPIPSKAFEVIVDDLTPFHIELRSLRGGHPPQIKLGRDYSEFMQRRGSKTFSGKA
jgi:hypothetical protein